MSATTTPPTPPTLEAPPPSPALRDAVQKGGPVRLRHPGRRAIAVLLASAAAAIATLVVGRVRGDLARLPVMWWLGLAALWLVTFVAPVLIVLVPPRHQMLPNVSRATLAVVLLLVGVFGSMALIALGLPAHELPSAPGNFFYGCFKCAQLGVVAGLFPLIITPLALRGVLVTGAWRAGAAVGAAAGALGGLVLHLHCPVGGLHPLVSHGGLVVVMAAVGAVLFRLVLGR